MELISTPKGYTRFQDKNDRISLPTHYIHLKILNFQSENCECPTRKIKKATIFSIFYKTMEKYDRV